jgi:CspA family cold shock protein
MPNRSTGTVKWFNDEKDFGLITPNGGEADIFMYHGSNEAGSSYTPKAGDKVSYVSETRKNGPQAEQVRLEG